MDVKTYMQQVGRKAREASRATARASTAAKNAALQAMAGMIRARSGELLTANAADVAEARAAGLDAAPIGPHCAQRPHDRHARQFAIIYDKNFVIHSVCPNSTRNAPRDFLFHR